MLDHLAHLLRGVFAAGVFPSVRRDHEYDMLRSFLLGRGGKTRAYGVYRPADGVEERGAAAREIFLVGQRSHLSKRDVIVQHLVLVVEQHGGDVRVALDLLLLFDKLVESAYRVGGKTAH